MASDSSICLFLCLFVCLIFCLSVCLSLRLSFYLVVKLFLSSCLCVCLSVCLFVCPSGFISFDLYPSNRVVSCCFFQILYCFGQTFQKKEIERSLQTHRQRAESEERGRHSIPPFTGEGKRSCARM